jgi:hypothetical protein
MRLALFGCAVLLATSAFAQQQAQPPSSRTSPVFSEVPQKLLDQTALPPQGLSALELEQQIQVARLRIVDRRRSCDRNSAQDVLALRDKAGESLEETCRNFKECQTLEYSEREAEKVCRLNAAMFFSSPCDYRHSLMENLL